MVKPIIYLFILILLPMTSAQVLIDSQPTNTNGVVISSPLTPSGGGNSSFNQTLADESYWRLDGTNDNLLSANWDMGTFSLLFGGDNYIKDTNNNLELFAVDGSYNLSGSSGISQTTTLNFNDKGTISHLGTSNITVISAQTTVLSNLAVLGSSATVDGKDICLDDGTNCPTDQDTQKTTNGFYLYNDTSTIFFNETQLNNTIDNRAVDLSQYVNTTTSQTIGGTKTFNRTLQVQSQDSFQINVGGTFTGSSNGGISVFQTQAPSTAINNVFNGFNFVPIFTGSNNYSTTNLIYLLPQFQSYSGTQTTVNGLLLSPVFTNPNTKITNYNGLRIQSFGASANITNYKALSIADITAGEDNYALQTGTGKVEFGDDEIILTNLPEGDQSNSIGYVCINATGHLFINETGC